MCTITFFLLSSLILYAALVCKGEISILPWSKMLTSDRGSHEWSTGRERSDIALRLDQRYTRAAWIREAARFARARTTVHATSTTASTRLLRDANSDAMGEQQQPQQQQGPAQQADAPARVRVGVLALQGSFREHMALLQRIPGVQAIEVRTKEELESVAGLVIPGGESTTMALVAERWGLIGELRAFAKAGKPIWGTCAGMIFLAERAQGEWHAPRECVGGGGHTTTPPEPTFCSRVARAQARRRVGRCCWAAWTSPSHATSSGRRCARRWGVARRLPARECCPAHPLGRPARSHAQINSFETQLPAPSEVTSFGG